MGAGQPPGRRVEVRTPAKINLFLAIRGRRPDGYHDLVSVMQTVALHDRLSVDIDGPPAHEQHPAAHRRMQISLSVDETRGVPAGRGNLVAQAAALLGARMGFVDPTQDWMAQVPGRAHRTAIALRKRIPVAGGMAGGSSDAAGTLVALNALWDCGLGVDDLRDMAADLGSDVPFCVVGGTALATGRGTQVARVLCRGTFHWVIGASDEPLSTADVYRHWDEVAEPSTTEPDVVLTALSAGDAEALGAALVNDLQPAVFRLRPELADARGALLDAGALGAVVSGSGPTVIGLAADEADAHRIADRVADHFDRVHTAASPAGGPELVR